MDTANFSKILTVFLAILLATLLTSNASAADNESEQEEQALVELGSEVIDRADYGSEDEFEQALNQLINDPDVLGVTAIDSRDSVEPVLIQPNKLLPYIKNVKHQGDYIQNVTLATVWADPGIETSLTNSWKRSATFSSNTGIKAAEASMGLNFTIGREYTVSYTGKYKAPNKRNGKKVAYVKLYAKPIRAKYKFDVYEPKRNWNPFADPYEKTGTGIAYKPIGVYYSKSYVYE